MAARARGLAKTVVVIARAARGYIYDWWRFALFAGYRYQPDPDRSLFGLVKTYHKLEKSFTLPNRQRGRGGRVAATLRRQLSYRENRGWITNHDVAAQGVLADYQQDQMATAEADDFKAAPRIDRQRRNQAILENPEVFFQTRRSIRQFKPKIPEISLVARGIELATNTPSVCNRQAWRVYLSNERDTIDRALAFQNGNSGFGYAIPTLLIVTVDLRAFETSAERYQHWIDGGMFSMSLCWALHSLGLDTCCLNWSQDPKTDQSARKALKIAPQHSVIMYIAVGYADDQAKVCASTRSTLTSIFSHLEVR